MKIATLSLLFICFFSDYANGKTEAGNLTPEFFLASISSELTDQEITNFIIFAKEKKIDLKQAISVQLSGERVFVADSELKCAENTCTFQQVVFDVSKMQSLDKRFSKIYERLSARTTASLFSLIPSAYAQGIQRGSIAAVLSTLFHRNPDSRRDEVAASVLAQVQGRISDAQNFQLNLRQIREDQDFLASAASGPQLRSASCTANGLTMSFTDGRTVKWVIERGVVYVESGRVKKPIQRLRQEGIVKYRELIDFIRGCPRKYTRESLTKTMQFMMSPERLYAISEEWGREQLGNRAGVPEARKSVDDDRYPDEKPKRK